MGILNLEDKIYIAGHKGLAGSAILKKFKSENFSNIITKTREQLDLSNNDEVESFFFNEKPDVVILAAAKVGGILANNTYRTEFLIDNVQIQNNVIMNAFKYGVHRFIFLGSSCVYPKNAIQPIKESCLLTGSLEYTNRPYAIAKIAGMELIHSLRQQHGKDYFSIMPTNLFGVNDNYHSENSHVVASLIRKFYEAVKYQKNNVVVWGDGTPMRELMSSDSLANAVHFLATQLSYEEFENSHIAKSGFCHINAGTGDEVSIKELATTIAELIGFNGDIIFDNSKPNGTLRKIMDSSFLRNQGWSNNIHLKDGLKQAIKSFIAAEMKI